jgi:hypothetical protein
MFLLTPTGAAPFVAICPPLVEPVQKAICLAVVVRLGFDVLARYACARPTIAPRTKPLERPQKNGFIL